MPRNKDTQYRYVKTQIDKSVKEIVTNLINSKNIGSIRTIIYLPKEILSSEVQKLWNVFENNMSKVGFVVTNEHITHENALVDMVIIEANTGQLNVKNIKYDKREDQIKYLFSQYNYIDEVSVKDLENAYDLASRCYNIG